MDSTKRRARVAGLIYMLMGVTAPIALLYVPDKLIVRDDPVATAERIRASEPLLRLGIGTELFHQAVAVFLVMALFRLFKPVNENRAWLMVLLGAAVSVPIMFANVLNEIAALTLAKGPGFLSVFDQPQRDALAYLFLRLHSYGITVASIFWGLWLFPFGMLVIRSGFIPPFLGILMMIAGASYVVSAATTLLLPQIAPVVDRYALILAMGELPIMFWLLIWGAREKPPATAAPQPATG